MVTVVETSLLLEAKVTGGMFTVSELLVISTPFPDATCIAVVTPVCSGVLPKLLPVAATEGALMREGETAILLGVMVIPRTGVVRFEEGGAATMLAIVEPVALNSVKV
jgi:hypothetical protein